MKNLTSQKLQLLPILGILVTLKLNNENHPSFLQSDLAFGLSGLYHSLFIFLLTLV